jgi:rhamnosyl/mannosyltransferase
MKILHFYKTCIPDTVGGVQLFIDQLATGLASRGADVDVLALSTERGKLPQLQRHGYRIHRVRQNFEIASTGLSFAAPRRFSELARNADVLHFHFPWPFMDAVHLALSKGKPSVVTYHSDIVRQKHLFRLYKPVENLFLRDAHRIVATSPQYLQTSAVLRRHADKVRVIPIGLDPQSYPPPPARVVESWRQRLGEGFFLFVGILRYYKGLEYLIEAAHLTGLPTVIVGSGPLERRLQRLSRGAPNIVFLGSLSEQDKAAVLSLCGALVLPSHMRSEAFGVALLEGSLHGKPLISTEIGTGTSHINRSDVTGFVVPPADPHALADAMRRLKQDPVLAATMGQQALGRSHDLFGADRMTDAYLELYREVLGNAPNT